MKSTNICIIGGGSRQWAISFMKDLMLKEMTSGHIALYDIDFEAAKNNESVARRMFKINKAENRFSVDAVESAEKALTGADLVIISIEPGDTRYRFGDLVLPEQYGILQTVGDTTGPGGLFRARRALPVFFEYARLIEKCCPNAWVINYTNPMTLCTAALYKAFPNIKAFGCCHEVFHLEEFIAHLAEKWFGVEKIDRHEINVNITGVNHFTWFTSASWNGIDLMPRLKELANKAQTFADKTDIAKQRIAEEKWFDCDQLISLELLRRFGALGAAGDRHLAEFVPWFLSDEEKLHTYGVIRTPYAWREAEAKRKREKTFSDEELIAKPSGEEGVDIMRALMGDGDMVTNMNIENIGQVSYLPKGHIVETNCVVSKNSIRPLTAKEPPKAVQALVSRIATEQDIALEAIWEQDDEKLFEAFLLDPLMKLPIATARELFNNMIDFANSNVR